METAGTDLSFVNLEMAIQNLPDSIAVFGSRIAFYGIIIELGVLAGMAVTFSDAKHRRQDPDVYPDSVLYSVVFSIIGARAYYVISDQDNYKDNLFQILSLRGGGPVMYDGVIGTVITPTVFTRMRKISFFSMANSGVLGLAADQIIGKWGNFFSRRAFGNFISNLFIMRIKKSLVSSPVISQQPMDNEIVGNGIACVQVHSTLLYESVWNLCVFEFTLWYRKHKKLKGEVLWAYFLGYGLGRVWIEDLRTGQLKLPGSKLAVSQLPSVALVPIFTGAIVYRHHDLEKGEKAGGDFPLD